MNILKQFAVILSEVEGLLIPTINEIESLAVFFGEADFFYVLCRIEKYGWGYP